MSESTIEQLKPEMQKANDIIACLEAQRNKASNDVVTINAELIAAQRKIAELEAKLKGDAPEADVRPTPKANGHAAEEASATA